VGAPGRIAPNERSIMNDLNNNIPQPYTPATKSENIEGALLINTSEGQTSKDIYKHLIDLGIPQQDIAFVNPDSDNEKDANDVNFKQLFLQNNSIEQLSHDLKNISPGVKTGYNIGEVDLIFPGGALSIIAAPTGHGKTTFLINCTLAVLKHHPDKHVYFISYEESVAAIMMSFFNTYLDMEITKGNNRSSIESFFRNGDSTYIKHDLQRQFQEKVKTFFADLMSAGRLKISYPALYAEELIEAIYFIKENDPAVGAICIDYMQLLKLKNAGRNLSRTEELKRICLLLKDCAIATGLPIILTAQFNRTVITEAHMSKENIGEAGDIERVATLIVGIFNRSYPGNVDRDKKSVPQEAKLMIEVLKGRRVGIGHSAEFDFDGNKGKVTGSEKHPDEPSDEDAVILRSQDL